MKWEEQGTHVYWVTKVVLLYRLSVTSTGEIQEFAYFQNMEVQDTVSGVGKERGCVGVRWSTASEVDRTFDVPESVRGNQLR